MNILIPNESDFIANFYLNIVSLYANILKCFSLPEVLDKKVDVEI